MLVHPDGYRITQVQRSKQLGRPQPYLRLARLGVGWLGDFATLEALRARLDRLGIDLADFTETNP